jgi:hypothetical protein
MGTWPWSLTYFASAWLLGDGIQRDLFMRKVGTNLYSVWDDYPPEQHQ